jgi:hypothetical protein
LKSRLQIVGEEMPAPSHQEAACSTQDPNPTAGPSEQRSSDLSELQQLGHELKHATDVCSKAKEDMERHKQVRSNWRSTPTAHPSSFLPLFSLPLLFLLLRSPCFKRKLRKYRHAGGA